MAVNLRVVRRHTRVRTPGFRLMEMGVVSRQQTRRYMDCTNPPARVSGRTKLPTKADFADRRSVDAVSQIPSNGMEKFDIAVKKSDDTKVHEM